MKRLMWGAGCVLLGASVALAVPPAADSPAGSDEDFVKTASGAGLAELNFAKLALEQSSGADVKAFAQHMIHDHTKANDELLKLADAEKLTPATKMDAKHQELFTKLSEMKGADFDKAYVQSQVGDHKEAVALFQSEAKNGKNDNLKAFAEKTLPTLQHHLEMVEKLAGGEKDK